MTKLRKANFPKQEYNKTFTQVTTNDSRFYEDGEKTYPSVTFVLSYYPKGKYFEEWLKKVGSNADFIAKKAAGEGTIVHELAEQYLKGDKIRVNQPTYTLTPIRFKSMEDVPIVLSIFGRQVVLSYSRQKYSYIVTHLK